MRGPESISVLLVDDHRVFCDVLAARLGCEPGICEVRIANSLAEARTVLRRWAPDVVLIDGCLQGESGLGLVTELAGRPRRSAVVVLSGNPDPTQAVSALAVGADGWIAKTASFESLVLAVRRVARGHLYLEPASLRSVVSALLARSEPAAPSAGFVSRLSQRQLEVLQCVVGGLSRAETAAQLHVSVNTVRTHVQALLREADVHSTLALAALARELGVTGSQP